VRPGAGSADETEDLVREKCQFGLDRATVHSYKLRSIVYTEELTMTSTASASGSAERWGPLWGARPEDWAANEEQQTPTYEEAVRRVGIQRGQRVLEVGCGSGVFLRLAADKGATVFGVDASEALLELARARVPEADLCLGDMQFLPYEDDTFDLVAGFNSFFFADDMVAALREAGRVARPGAPVVIQVWGNPKRCSLEAMKVAVAPFLPGAAEARKPPDFWRPGVLEAMAAEAGLAARSVFDTTWPYEYPDEETMVRGLLSAGGLALVAEAVGGDTVQTAIADSLAPYRNPNGGYRLENEWHFVVASA
jgi:SAM-dependent methyltransferase